MSDAPNTTAAAEATASAGSHATPRHGRAGAGMRRPARSGNSSRPRGRTAGSGFYAGVLDAADRLSLADAAAVRGIDQEVAVLRLRLRRLLGEHPEDFALTVRSIELLVRAVGAAGKLAADDSSDVLDHIYAELGGIVALIADAADAEPPSTV